MPSGSSARRGGGAGSLVFSLPNAANWAAASYQGTQNSTIANSLAQPALNAADVQAYLLNNGLLLIPGSNSAMDYLRYNLRLLNVGGKRYKVKSGATGQVLGSVWHQGFLAHAMLIYEHFKATPPKFIIAHSLGAASAQILSMIWNVPAIGFAAPRLYAGGRPYTNTKLSLSLFRHDDPVGSLPGAQFRHTGTAIQLGKSKTTSLLNHSMKHYQAAITDPNHRSVLPATWPM